MRPTLSSLASLVRSVLLTEARNTAETFLTYTLGSDLALGGNENECRLRRQVVARMIANPELSFASFSSLASIIVKQSLFKPSPSASVEEWVASVKSAWQRELDEAGIAELTKDLGAKLSPKTQSAGRPTPEPKAQSAGRPDPEPRGSAGAGQGRYKRKISPAELQQILDLHLEYLKDPNTGHRAVLTYADLTGANLTDAYLTHADLYGADLTGANLRGANLTNAYLTIAHLTSADLTRANLQIANLTEARLMNANLTSADLSYAYLIAANLSSANLSGANLRGARLAHANLQSANFTDARLMNARLMNANLSSANLVAANLSSANLTSANLSRADLWLANLSGATYDSKTIFPHGFDPAEQGMVLVK